MHDYVPYHVCLLSRRAAAVRQELQAEVDQLPQAGPQEGSVLAGRGGPHHPSPFHDGQQVGGATVAGHAYSRSPARPVFSLSRVR